MTLSISQGTCLRPCGIFTDDFARNILLRMSVKESWKSVTNWRSYREEFIGSCWLAVVHDPRFAPFCILHCVSKTSYLRLAIILTYTIRLREFLAEMLLRKYEIRWRFGSHLTYLVLQHYLAKEETQKTAHWYTVRATQSNCCNVLNFLSRKPCRLRAMS